MNLRRSIKLTFVFLTAILGIASFSTISSARAKNSVPILGSMLNLAPLQFNVGFNEIDSRIPKIKEEIEKGSKKFDAYLKSRPVQVVRDRGGKLYIINGNHFARALFNLGIVQIYYVEIENYSKLSQKAFERKLKKKQYLFLRDNGEKRPFNALPKTVAQLTDDPYRSLAWAIRRMGGYKDLDLAFQEFYWADFFRKRVKVDFSTHETTNLTLAHALTLAHSKKARKLSGYISKPKGKKCMEDMIFKILGRDSTVDPLSEK